MSPAEVFDRARQHVSARSDALRPHLATSFPVNMPRSDRATRPKFFFSSEDVPRICDALRRCLPEQATEIQERAERVCTHHFDLLGHQNLDYGALIDWHLDAVHGKRAPRKPFYAVPYLDFAHSGDVKVTWELNRHQHFVTLAKAYRLFGDDRFVVELLRQWQAWHAENPYPVGVNWASSLEVAFRSLSWIWAGFLLEDCSLVTVDFRREWLGALGTSARHISRYLSTYFSPNTHLLGEAVALFFIGTLCPELAGAKTWQTQGWELVLQEAERQVRPDGLHFEQSAYYHVYALDFFLHARILAARNRIEIPSSFDRTLVRMLEALQTLGRCGPVPSFGDDDGGRLFDGHRNLTEHLLDPLAVGAVLFGRGDFKASAGNIREETLWLLGLEGAEKFQDLAPSQPALQSRAFADSGLYVMADSGANGQLIMDCGPHGTGSGGHGHADALSVWVNVGGRAVLVDSGTFEYLGDGPERNAFRGTSAHNTLTVDSLDQAEPRGPFGWKALPRASVDLWINGRDFDLLAAHHDGYQRLSDPVTHHRWVFALKSRFWFVRDVASGEGEHQLDLHWHLAPELAPGDESATVFRDIGGPDRIYILRDEEDEWDAGVISGFRSPAYGRKQSAQTLHFSATRLLPTEFATLLVPVSGLSHPLGELSRVRSQIVLASAWEYQAANEEHRIVFRSGASAWSLGLWTSDAEFLYYGQTDAGQRRLTLCNVTFVEANHTKVVTCERSMERIEITEAGGHSEFVSSADDRVRFCGSLAAMSDGPGTRPRQGSPAAHGVNS